MTLILNEEQNIRKVHDYFYFYNNVSKLIMMINYLAEADSFLFPITYFAHTVSFIGQKLKTKLRMQDRKNVFPKKCRWIFITAKYNLKCNKIKKKKRKCKRNSLFSRSPLEVHFLLTFFSFKKEKKKKKICNFSLKCHRHTVQSFILKMLVSSFKKYLLKIYCPPYAKILFQLVITVIIIVF